MAEYNDVIKHFKRMCRYYNNRATQNDCPLYCKGHGCNISHCRLLAFDDKKFQNVVMAWAETHKEPVYPTWEEYLILKGLLMPYWNEQGTAPYDMYVYAARALANHIPADIAEKLGIAPKEGT